MRPHGRVPQVRAPLPLVQVADGEDASLWWQVLCNCQCSLTLLRSRYDANGAEWLPSAYWDAVVQLVEGLSGRIEKPGLGDRPGVDAAACCSELLEALASGRASAVPLPLAASWAAVQAAQAVAACRDGWGALTPHEGVMVGDAVVAHLRSRYGPGRSWSLSRLNRYGICPYAFWAQQALELEALIDPAEGMDAMQRGTLIHKLLELLFARLTAAGIAPGPDTLDPIRTLLDTVCDEVFPGASERYGFRPGPLWEHEQAELRAELHGYMAWECAPEQSAGFQPYRQELRFGMERGTAPVLIPGFEGAAIALRGVIDRVDLDAAGRLRVIDYKTGSTRYTEKDIAAGRALQTALYAWAVEEILPGCRRRRRQLLSPHGQPLPERPHPGRFRA